MINIKKITYKNLLASGNHPIVIDLTDGKKTLVVGHNGAGKSTIIEAICFGLFGKSFRNLNKPDLVNTINKKNLEVVIDLAVNGKDYRVKRGIKPNVFEIHEGEKLITQSAAAKDYQDHLEKNILNINFNSFRQIVILGSGGYVPFMELTAATRREVVENLLDLTIFSTMSNLLKEKISANKISISENETALYRNDSDFNSLLSQIEFIKKAKAQADEEIDSKKAEINQKISDISSKLDEVTQQYEALADPSEKIKAIRSAREKLSSELYSIDREVAKLKKDSSFYETNDDCPVCRQVIDSEFKSNLISCNHKEIEDHLSKKTQFEEKISKLEDALETLSKNLDARNELLSKRRVLLNETTSLKSYLDDLEKKEAATVETYDVEDIRQKLAAVKDERVKLTEEKAELAKMKGTLMLAATLVKDTGIKSKIIKKYIPIINKSINHYLGLMDFYVQFELDENFKETIRSRYRDTFSYENFSEGQKARINMAILFTWRAIAKMKNSMNVDLLLFDEVMDSSLDKEGVEAFLKIIDQLTDTNVVLISHKTDEILDQFPKILNFKLNNKFSTVEETII